MLRSATERIEDNPGQRYTGMAVVDLDGDGAFECVVGARGGRNVVLKWGGEAFYDVGLEPLVDTRGLTMGLCAADVDGDGREELYLGAAEGSADKLLAWRGGGWKDLLAGVEQKNQSTQSVLAVDRFGMGRYGMLVGHEGGPYRFWDVMGQDRVVERGAELGLARIAGARSMVSAPLVGEGMAIYAGNEGIANMLFVPGEGQRYRECGASVGLGDSEVASRGMAVLDVNFDGRWDVVCAHAKGPARMYVQGSRGIFLPIEITSVRGAEGVVVADFDNDGFEEIVFPGRGMLAWRDGDWRLVECAVGRAAGAVVGDWDGDGRLELMVADEVVDLYVAETRERAWLRVMPVTAAGAAARGAVVKMSCAGRVQMRVIDCGSGYLCQSEPVAHFGLGDREDVEWVEVRWVDGTVVRVERPAARKLLRVGPGSVRIG
jgi:hypothetical protein